MSTSTKVASRGVTAAMKAAPALHEFFAKCIAESTERKQDQERTSDTKKTPGAPPQHHQLLHPFKLPHSHVHDSVVVRTVAAKENGEEEGQQGEEDMEVWPPFWAQEVEAGLRHDDDGLRRAIRNVLGATPTPLPNEMSQQSSHAAIEIEPLFGGNTNKVYKLSVPCCTESNSSTEKTTTTTATATTNRTVLVREYATGVEDFIDREHEVAVARTMACAGVSPALYRCYDWGRVEEYLEAHRNATLDDFLPSDSDNNNSKSSGIPEATMENFAMIHGIKQQQRVVQEKSSSHEYPHWTGNTLRAHLRKLREYSNINSRKSNDNDDSCGGATATTTVPAPPLEQLIAYFEAEVALVIDAVERHGGPLVFSHNDLNMGNVMIREEEEEETATASCVKFIDFEYSATNHRCFDIGNHLAEWNYDYDPRHPNGYATRYKATHCELLLLHPDDDSKPFEHADDERRRKDVILSCLSRYAETVVSQQQGKEAVSVLLPALVCESFVGMMASHLVWSLWSLTMGIQTSPRDPCGAAGSSGLNYVTLAQRRLDDYCDVKAFCVEHNLC